MFDYFSGIAWLADAVLAAAIALTGMAIFFYAALKEYLWEKRRRGLLNIKNNVYEMVLAGERPSGSVCQPFAAQATPQQFLDVETNRSIGAAFFNDSERQLFKSCFITPGQINGLEKIARGSISKWRRIEAMLSLGYMQAESAIGVFKRPLLSNDDDLAYYSIVALAQIKTVKSAKMLLNFLKKNPSSGYKIASILEGFPEEISGDLIQLTDSRNVLVRFWAATILSKFASERHIDKIEKLIHDASPEVRAAACGCLGRIGNDAAKKALLKRLKDDNWLVKRSAVSALEHIMGDASVPEVIALINDSSWSVVDAVKDVMTRHIKASLPYIEKFLAGEDQIPKKYSIMTLVSAPDDLDPYTKKRISEILSKTGSGR